MMTSLMEVLTIESTYRVVLGDVSRFRIMAVGSAVQVRPWLCFWPGWLFTPDK